MTKFVNLTHPGTGAETRQPESTARALYKRGWVDASAGAPPKSAPKQEWVDHATSQGVDPAEAEAMTKEQLVDAHGD